MFRKDLIRRFENIFGFEGRTTFNAYSQEFEQDTLFIEIDSARPKISGANGGLETARVVGQMVVFSQDEVLPYGVFAKKIELAKAEDKSPLFFYDMDVDVPSSPAREQNIHERRCSFIFLYNSQFDPDKGELTSLELTIEEV